VSETGVQSIESIVARAKLQDPEALRLLIERASGRLNRIAGRFCPAGELEDAVQDVLIRSLSHLGALRVAGSYFAWVGRMLVRRCIEYQHRVRRWVQVETVEASTNVPPAFEMREAFSRLSPQAQLVLLHRDVFEYTAEETAGRLGLTLECVKSRHRRAKTQLREMFASREV
jgi:RNA polymerase sigma factor (sigma-70 family)